MSNALALTIRPLEGGVGGGGGEIADYGITFGAHCRNSHVLVACFPLCWDLQEEV